MEGNKWLPIFEMCQSVKKSKYVWNKNIIPRKVLEQ